MLWRCLCPLAALVLSACASTAQGPDFSWPKDRDAVPDERTAIQVSIAIFCGSFNQFRMCSDRDHLAKSLSAFRYRTSDLVHDPKGDAWYVEPSPEEKAEWDKMCGPKARAECIGGILYDMALSAHDATVLEFYLPE